ncbi:hypothetical protein E2C01_079236 [Portunus trituberculatus]|uniref:Uncharacterized protein n=1 Tax=Portunus trituberculatus TaxID=210409 RepID=A0A5B7ISS7_PORTR|nr:hypothetical protein [Portunus trituberculatus]
MEVVMPMISMLIKLLLSFFHPISYHDAFPYSFSLLFGGFMQLQKLMWGIRIVKTVAINFLTSIDPS